MKQELLDEVIACLPKSRTLFHYHRDRYSLYLLERLFRQGKLCTLADVKRSRYASWLEKPALKQAAASLGNARASVQELLIAASSGLETQPYVLTLGQWGSEANSSAWFQTSRPGLNLVLRLNLPLLHVERIRQLGAHDFSWLERGCHPIDNTRITLAWARLDLDFGTGEALIEEIQSDWTRDMSRLFRSAHRMAERGREQVHWWYGLRLDTQQLLDYEKLLQAQQKLWSEAMLTAALWFLLEEMGLRDIYYHSWETGTMVKRIHKKAPPRSLYSELPERFAFERSPHGPDFLEQTPRLRKIRRRPGELYWYHWAA